MQVAEMYMQRCLQLAAKGAGFVSPNPLVGAVLVYQDRIIGEGWHERYGGPHAEVNCLQSVSEGDRQLISESILYVSLEPCAHQGKTPPCADLIVESGIRQVVVACTDSFSEVDGKGIQKLQAAGITVHVGILEKEARWQNRRFFTVQERNRPYIILKWAVSANGYLAPADGERVMMSNTFSQLSVQQQRATEDAVLVGYRTALQDNPRLSNRSGTGRQPFRMVTDFELSLPDDLHIFDGTQATVIFNLQLQNSSPPLYWHKLEATGQLSRHICDFATDHQLSSLIVEGGQKTLQAFLHENLWDEAFIYHTPLTIQDGVTAPPLPRALLYDQYQLGNDRLRRLLHFDTAAVFHQATEKYLY